MVMRISLWKERGHLFPLEEDLITGKSNPEKQTVTQIKGGRDGSIQLCKQNQAA